MEKPDFDKMLEEIYKTGGNPEFVYTTLERALAYGFIGPKEYALRRVLRFFHIPQPNIRFKEKP